MNKKIKLMISLVASICAVSAQAQTTETESEQATKLAKQLANPVASLISVPFQYNYDSNLGPNDDGTKSYLNIQPVTPFSISEDWNLIVRTIVPVIDLEDVTVKGDSASGLGDITQSFFFSPKAPVDGWILALGPVGLYPSASEDLLGGGKWGVGPTGLALQQKGHWTYGVLWNHLWSVAGDSDRNNINATFIQPGISYISKTKSTVTLNTESTYDWENEEWSVPINLMLSQLMRLGPQIVQFTVGARYWVESPEAGPEDWGVRAQVILLFPEHKK
ncbi:transporter [Kiritimatiellota bacterium B12222]|nr:transporter [Kiritimatiellota bacterium B12222]